MKIEIKDGDICQHCGFGIMRKRVSKFGEFLACDDFPKCANKKSIKQDLTVGQAGYRI